MTRSTALFIVCLFLCLVPGLLGGMISSANIGIWYDFLAKPMFTPPNWIFGPVWVVLYMLMSVILFIILKSNVPSGNKNKLLILFVAQMILNFSWSPVFFGVHAPFFAFSIIVLMVALCIDFVREAHSSMPALAYMMYPYIIWLCYAGYLNGGIYMLN